MSLVLDEIIPTPQQNDFLYGQLKMRSHNISHVSLPSYESHKKFVYNHPYRAWFIIREKDIVLGNVYVQYDNSIGLNCSDEIMETQIKAILESVALNIQPLDSIPSVRGDNFFLNVAASNLNLQNKLKNLGLKESQRSFVFET